MNKFYVYTLKDPRNNEVFYVGKGKNDRIYRHVKFALKGNNLSNPYKYNKIMQIINSGNKVIEEIIIGGISNEDACELEKENIAYYRSISKSMTNVTDGGEGTLGLSPWNKGLTKETDDRLKIMSINSKGKKSNTIPWNKGLTKETDDKVMQLSIKNIGKESWNKGKSKETDDRIFEYGKKISKKLKGKKKSKEHVSNMTNLYKKGNIPWNKGKNDCFNEESLEKIKNNDKSFKKGHIPWNKGKKMDEEFCKKVSIATRIAMENLPEDSKLRLEKTLFKKKKKNED